MTVNYADTAMVHAYGGFTDPTDEDDALLELFIGAASAAIDNHCGRVFAIADGAATVARTFTADNGTLMYIGRMLFLDDDLCSTPTYAEAPAPTVTYIPRDTPYVRLVREDGIWPDPTEITGHWAHSMTPPAPIILACLRLVMWMYHQKETGDTDRPIIANGLVIMPAKLPEDIAALLAPYRKPMRP